MLFADLFKARAKKAAVERLPTGREETGQGPETLFLSVRCREIYAQFLNDYIAHGFAQEEGESEVQRHFYAQALALARFLAAQAGYDENVEMEASRLAEQQRQKARRNYLELRELAESVLIDQRNYLLASHINSKATAMGFKARNGTPFSGMETENGQPCHAFALKLLADSSLGRGPATGLKEDAVTMLEHHIARQAEADIACFLAAYARDHEAL